MSLYKQFATDGKMETQGIDIDYGGAVIRICRAGGSNAQFGKVMGYKMKPYRRQLENGTMSDDKADDLLKEVYAETVVIGWAGVTDENGNEMEYSKQNAVKLFTDLPELFRDIVSQAQKVSNFRTEELESDSKNSQTCSGGSLSGAGKKSNSK